MKNHILIIPDKPDLERDSIAKAWKAKGGKVLRIGKFWIKSDIGNKKVVLYGYDSFCLVLAQILGLDVVSPKDEWIAMIDYQWTKRNITLLTIEELEEDNFPIFIKPITPKLFRGKIYTSKEELTIETEGIKPQGGIILSEAIVVEKEVRAFILDKEVKDISFYEGEGNVDKAKDFLNRFLFQTKIDLPRTFVLDAGFNEIDGWFILEFNASWGVGLNGCDANQVIDCIEVATINS
ncbi:MAG: hypothetical protein ACI94Y_002569 [Maribacter sp.]|jgi:hypothetical protein